MEKWFVATKKADFNGMAECFGISPVTARIIRNRDVEGKEAVHKFLYGTIEDLYEPMLLKGMEKAVCTLEHAIREGLKIRIIGDYDVDGICAAHILQLGLKKAGADVDTAIPHRIKDGYGLNEYLIREAHEAGIKLIVTCDNGIAAAEQTALAGRLGMKVVVTDHHEVPYEIRNGVRRECLPEAEAVVDPKQADCTYPWKGICGGVVAFKVMQALYEKIMPKEVTAIQQELLPFAAIATVCDVMELLDENRIIVREGLKLMRAGACPGIRALMDVNGIEPSRLSAYHLGFVLGPCMNATGRLDTAMSALELLGSEETGQAVNLAATLKELNDSRKSMTIQGVKAAEAKIEELDMQEDKVFVIYLPDCHESLAGIVAGRIRETHGKPVFVLTDSEDLVKGSGRSIDAYNMYEEMSACREYFVKFGGHKLAAGLSMKKEMIEPLRKRLNQVCSLTSEDYIKKIHIDVPMPLSYANQQIAKELELLEPFGAGNPKPLFAVKNVKFLFGKRMGADQSFAKYTVEDDSGKRQEVVFFGNLPKFHEQLAEKYGREAQAALYGSVPCGYEMNITYQLSINSYRGRDYLQIIMQDFA